MSQSCDHNINAVSYVSADNYGSSISPLGEADEQLVIIDDEIVDPRELEDAVLPGIAKPLDGERLSALAESIRAEGQLYPIYVGRTTRRVYDGRSRRRACVLLRVHVRVVYIDDDQGRDIALASAMHRHMTLSEKAFFILQNYETGTVSRQLKRKVKGEKTRDTIGRWLKTCRGWTDDTSGRQVADYLKLAERLRSAENREELDLKVAQCSTVKQALAVLGLRTPPSGVSPETRILWSMKRTYEILEKGANVDAEMYGQALREAERLCVMLKHKLGLVAA